MKKVFITGSADGLGQMAAQLLINDGHQVVLHARNEAKGKEGLSAGSKRYRCAGTAAGSV